jgi:hypothetical protein
MLAHLPAELHYLIDPAMKYGIYQTDDDQLDFLENASDEERDELARLAERYRLNGHADFVSDFFDDCPITDYPESARLYWLFGLIDHLGLPLSPENWDTVENHIGTLRRFGSFRRASERAVAAKFLANFGEKARSAIPTLHQALQDEDLRVRVWTHYALALIEGDSAGHEDAVRLIYAEHNAKDDLGCHIDDVGAEASEALEKFRESAPKLGSH